MTRSIAQQTAIDMAEIYLTSAVHTTYTPTANDANSLADFIETLTARLEKLS